MAAAPHPEPASLIAARQLAEEARQLRARPRRPRPVRIYAPAAAPPGAAR
jgi:hypothetical protein